MKKTIVVQRIVIICLALILLGILLMQMRVVHSNETADEESVSDSITEGKEESESSKYSYVLNASTKKFHYPSCRSVKSMSEENREAYTGSRTALIKKGYQPCGICHP